MIVICGLVALVIVLALLPGVVAGPLSWLLVGYIVWRAVPAIRKDVRGLGGRHSGRLPGSSRLGAWR